VPLKPVAGRELREHAGGEQGQADDEGADDPVQLHAPLEHEPVEQGQHKNQTAASAKKEEQRWAVMEIRSTSGERLFFVMSPPPGGTSARPMGEEGTCGDSRVCCGETLRKEFKTFL
jgi:hypothetical protein